MGRADPAKVPIVAAVSTNDSGNPLHIKPSALAGFTREAIANWARANLTPDCAHSFIVVGNRKPRDMPQFTWVNTVLGDLKTAISGGHKAFKFAKYASNHLGAFACRTCCAP